jgi:SAM-dependent methyltransferase
MLENGRINFLGNPIVIEKDVLNQIKNIVKKYPLIYRFLAEVLAPVYVCKRTLKNIIKEVNKENLIGLNIGSGVTNYSDKILNFDLQPFKNVEIVGDLFKLPFPDSTFDYVFSIYVLEHIPNPERAISEMYRVLKPGGICYCFIPFIQGFHAAPNDFIRLTSRGVEQYFSEFDILTNRGLGPTSALLWVVQEWIAILFSFNNKKLHFVIHTLTMIQQQKSLRKLPY